MPNPLTITIADIELQLFAQCGAYWPEHQALFIADTHFGKEATFRRHGIPVPTGSTDGTLEKIDSLLDVTGATELFILGDMFHARSSLSPDVLDSLTMFFDDYPDVTFTLIRGNHDESTGTLPIAWPIQTVAPGYRIGQIALGHDPSDDLDDAPLLLCGHLHPAIKVGTSSERFKLPCFWYTEQRLVFPAMGKFTGTHVISPSRLDRCWPIADQEVFEWTSKKKTQAKSW